MMTATSTVIAQQDAVSRLGGPDRVNRDPTDPGGIRGDAWADADAAADDLVE